MSDKNSRKKYVDEIIKNTYQTYTDSLPFYASYDLDEFDKLFKIIKTKVTINSGKKIFEKM